MSGGTTTINTNDPAPPQRSRRTAWRWTGDLLAELERRWRAGEPRAALAAHYGTSPGRIKQIAKANGWPARRAGNHKAAP